jgi:hypothetical protein
MAEVELNLDKISFLLYKGKLLEAHQVYQQLLEHIGLTSPGDENEVEMTDETRELLEKNKPMLDELQTRYCETIQTIADCTSSHDEWILGSERFGIPSYYRVDADGLLCLRLEGSQETPIFEQMAVLYEVSLHKEWIPFCDQSTILKKMCKSISLLLFLLSNEVQRIQSGLGTVTSRHLLLFVILSFIYMLLIVPKREVVSPLLVNLLVQMMIHQLRHHQSRIHSLAIEWISNLFVE